MDDHINYPIIAKTHTPMYSMHKYWTRKPHNVVSKYVEKYSNKDEIVYDPFCGSGVTVFEALKLGRKAVGTDLSPISYFITKSTLLPVNLEELKKQFEAVINSVKNRFGYLYLTYCTCGNEAKLMGIAWKDNAPFQRVYDCNDCGRKRDNLIKHDLNIIDEVNDMEIKHWYPDVELPPMKKERLKFVHELFSKKNLIITSALYSRIEAVKDKNVKEILKFIFTSGVANFTNMMPYVNESPGKICKGWITHSYWVPPKHWELNVLNYFTLRYKEIFRGKGKTNEYFSDLIPAKKFDDLLGEADYYLNINSAMELIDDKMLKNTIIPENSIDYIFTDPPYGGSIQFFELNVLWASWLNHNANGKYSIDFESEITINKYQKKKFNRYDRMMRQAFAQIYRTLKSKKYMTVTFHSTQIRIRNSLIRAVVFGGFDMEKIIYQPPAVISVKAQRQPYGSAIGDYYIRFMKTAKKKKESTKEIDEIRYEKVVVESVKKILAERREPTSYSYIINFVDVELEKNGLLLGAKLEIKEILNKYLDQEFVLIKVEEGFNKGTKWWLKNPSEIAFLHRIPLNERIEKAVIDVLKSKDSAVFNDILQYIFMKFPNSLTPETQSIKSMLEEYAMKTKNKGWRLNYEFKESENKHQRIINHLLEIGIKAGYEVWSAHKDDTARELSIDNLSLPLERLERVKEIDVLWIQNNQVYYLFEVEHTTQITEAIVRASNIPYDIKRFIIIPKKREKLLKSKFEEPLLKERLEKEQWNIIIYDDLIEFYDKIKREKEIELDNFLILGKIPMATSQKQKDILEFSKK